MLLANQLALFHFCELLCLGWRPHSRASRLRALQARTVPGLIKGSQSIPTRHIQLAAIAGDHTMRGAAWKATTIDKVILLGVDLSLAFHTTEAWCVEMTTQNMKHVHILAGIGTARSHALDLALSHALVLRAKNSAKKNHKGTIILVIQQLGTIGTTEAIVMPATRFNLHISLRGERTETSVT